MKKNNKHYESLEKARKEALDFYKKKAMIQVLDYNEQNGMSRVYLAFYTSANNKVKVN